MPETHKKITAAERDLIALLKGRGKSNKEIARQLGKHPTSIGREISRNQFKGRYYVAIHAQAKTDQRKILARKRHPLKNKNVFDYVTKKLRRGWSPEVVAGRLNKRYQGDPYRHICHETIYAWIFAQAREDNDTGLRWYEYLRRKQKKRKKQTGRSVHRSHIPDRISIHERPKEVEKRKMPGHWEGDSIVGKGSKNGLHTAYERVSSLTRIEKMDYLTSEESIKAQEKIYSPLPKKLRRSTTLDNGKEHVKHQKLKYLIKTYFADPYSSWQRGGNENANLWIRYYFPKGTDFSKVSRKEIRAVERELNNRPRKRLQYMTPLEVFNNYLKGCDSK